VTEPNDADVGLAVAAPVVEEREPGPETAAIWVLLTPMLPWLVALPFGDWLLPLVAPLTVYPAFALRVREGQYGSAWRVAMAWAALLSLGVIILVAVHPALAARGILHGAAYKEEMREWVAGNEAAKEVSPSRFIPEHLLHLAAFLVLTLVSAGYLGLVLGAFLTAYMSYFVGSLAVASSRPVVAALAAWVPWSVIRVMSFVLLGVLLARPLLLRRRWPFERREAWLFALAFAGIAADIALKTALAPRWGLLLRGLLER
jgi:hypothetical protein